LQNFHSDPVRRANADEPRYPLLMTTAGGNADDWREYAAALLGEVATWPLTEAQWDYVSQIIGRIEAAVAAGEDLAAERAVVDLESAGPFRAVRAGSAAVIPQPEPLRERCAELIHTLRDRPAADEAVNADQVHRVPGEQAGAAQRS
jgi:hypothetical protein